MDAQHELAKLLASMRVATLGALVFYLLFSFGHARPMPEMFSINGRGAAGPRYAALLGMMVALRVRTARSSSSPTDISSCRHLRLLRWRRLPRCDGSPGRSAAALSSAGCSFRC